MKYKREPIKCKSKRFPGQQWHLAGAGGYQRQSCMQCPAGWFQGFPSTCTAIPPRWDRDSLARGTPAPHRFQFLARSFGIVFALLEERQGPLGPTAASMVLRPVATETQRGCQGIRPDLWQHRAEQCQVLGQTRRKCRRDSQRRAIHSSQSVEKLSTSSTWGKSMTRAGRWTGRDNAFASPLSRDTQTHLTLRGE